MKYISNVLDFKRMTAAEPKGEPSESEGKTKTITFQPTDEVRQLISEALEALGEVGKIRGTRTKLINNALLVGLETALRDFGDSQRVGLKGYFARASNKQKKSGKGK